MARLTGGAARLPFLDAAVGQRVAGGRLYDAHIVSIALHARSKVIVTDNIRHFRSGAGDDVRVLSASELLAELARGPHA